MEEVSIENVHLSSKSHGSQSIIQAIVRKISSKQNHDILQTSKLEGQVSNDVRKLYHINTSSMSESPEGCTSKIGLSTAIHDSSIIKRYQLINPKVTLHTYALHKNLDSVSIELVEKAALYVVNCYGLHPLILSVGNYFSIRYFCIFVSKSK